MNIARQNFAAAMSAGTLEQAADAPADARSVLFQRAGQWAQAGQSTEHPSVTLLRLSGFDVGTNPADTGDTAVELRNYFAPVGLAVGEAQPAGVLYLNVRGELLAPPEDFAARLDRANRVELSIDSPGGDAFAALSMVEALRASGKPVRALVDRYAGSAAAILLQGATRRVIAPDARLLLHAGATAAYGTEAALRRAADELGALSLRLVALFAGRTGRDPAEVAAWFSGPNFWFDAPAALAAGLVDEIFPHGDGSQTRPAPSPALAGPLP